MVIIIQITDQYVKMTLAKQEDSRLQVVSLMTEPVGTLNEIQIAGRIRDRIKKWNARPKQVVLSLPRNTVTVRNLHLPSQDKEETAQMVDLNIVRSVPYKREDIVSGYRTLGLDEAGYTRAIMAIVKIDLVRRLVGIVEKAGLDIDRIVVGSYGVWKRVKAQLGAEYRPGDLCLALDVDDGFTDFIVFSSEYLFFTRSINIGARALSEQGGAGAGKFTGEVRQFLMMFYNEEINKKPGRIFMCGARAGRALMPELEKELGIPVQAFDSVPQDIPAEVSMASLSGLDAADDQIDLILPEMQVRRALSRTTRDLVILGGLCIYILTIVCGLYWGRIYNQENYLARLNRMVADTDKDIGDLAEKLKKVEFIQGYLDERQVPLLIFAQLQKAIPARTALTSVTVDEQGHVVLRGQAAALSDVFKFIDNLDQAGYFKDVQTRSTKKRKVRDRDLIEFELSFIFS